MPIKVAIAEDIDDIRDGLRLIINNTDGFECGCVCKNGQEALEKIQDYQPDVVLMDINMPGINGVEAVRQLKPKMPSTQFMMCTVYEEDEHVFESLKAGATGYILKKTQPARLIEAILDIHNGGSPMSSTIARKVMTSFNANKVTQPVDALSQREKDVLNMLGRGMQYKTIAAALSLSPETVRTHIRNIYEKLQVHTREEALRVAYKS
ncbi:MAG: response regulator transcription factor [Chitinophagaceae bacterium]